jgi:transposase InsO family protein
MCDLLKVGRSSYYGWLNKLPSARELENQKLAMLITDIFIERRCIYGARRIRGMLLMQGISISRRRVGKLMKKENLRCKIRRKFKITTNSKHHLPIAPNMLQRNFSAMRADQKYVGDITYVWTQEGWLYLTTVIDLFSRRIVGWSMNKRMTATLVNDALLMALWKRKPSHGLIWCTDRGSQYASESHRDLLKERGVIQSMSRKGNCWDNSVAESFFHTLKIELTHHLTFKRREEAKQVIFEYIEVFYNRKRIHSANDYLSPAEYEMNESLN